MAKTKITDEMITLAGDLAKKGYTHSQIAKVLGVSRTTIYGNVNILNTIKRSEAQLKAKVAGEILASSEMGEVAAQIFLSKRMNLFTSEFKMGVIKDAKTALKELSRVTKALSEGEIPSELANNLVKYITEYIKIYEITELQKEVAELREMIEGSSQDKPRTYFEKDKSK